MVFRRAVVCVRLRPRQHVETGLTGMRAVCFAAATIGLLTAAVGCTSHDSHHASAPAGNSSAQSSAATGAAPQSSASGSSAPTPSTSSKGGIPNAVHKTVPAKTLATAKPVATNETAKFGNRVTARISSIKHINAVAHGVGEISGPAAEVTFVIQNGTSHAIDLGSVSTNLLDAAGTPSVSMTGSPADPLTGTVAPGKSSSGTYVFALSNDHRNPVTISLSYTTEAPVVLFTGDVQ